jgi:DNA-binding NarL/FixJ family response regulator
VSPKNHPAPAPGSIAAPRPIRISIVEDDDRIREGLAALIQVSGGFECVSTHGSAEDACRQIPQTKPEVVLMDINLPNMSGIECVQKLKAILPSIKIVMHTVYDDEDRLFESLRAGADGYLLKRTPAVKLLEAMAEVYRGQSPMSGEMARMVVDFFHQRGSSGATDVLTGREKEILAQLAEGYRYKEIAERLGIGVGTVRTHLNSIYEKLHVTSRTEAVVKYLKAKS